MVKGRLFKSEYLFTILCGVNIGVLTADWFAKNHGIVQNDTWWQIEAGKAIASGNWPVYNTWSWTLPHVQWMVQEPWFDLMEWQLSRLGYWGLAAIPFVFALICAIFLVMRMDRVKWTQRLLVICVFFDVTMGAWQCRPQVVDYAGFAFLLWALDRKRYWYIPPAVALWANMHSGVVIAPFIIGCFAVESLVKKEEQRLKLLMVTGISILATMANYYGWGIWTYAFKTFFDTGVFGEYIKEWMPPPLNNPLVSILFLLLPGVPLILTGLRGGKTKVVETAIFLIFYGLSLRSYRFMPYMIIAWIAMMTPLFSSSQAPRPTRGGLTMVTAVAASFVISGFICGWPAQYLAAAARIEGYPAGAVEYIQKHHLNNIFNYYGWGGYLIYEGIPVYIDGRSEVYYWNSPDIFTRYVLATSQLKDVDEALGQSKFALLPKESLLADYLEEGRWQIIRTGKNSVLLGRKG